MIHREQIKLYYSKARELVKQNKPKEARKYVVEILNCALKSYDGATSLVDKAKVASFLDQWIGVSKELYSKGITENVLVSFGLATKKEPKKEAVSKNPPKKTVKGNKPTPDDKAGKSGGVDMAGLFDDKPKGCDNPPKEDKASTDKGSNDDKLRESNTKSSDEDFQGWAAKVFEDNKNCIVKIMSFNESGSMSTGTGFVIGDGYIMTNKHVIFDEGAKCVNHKINIKFYGDINFYPLTVLQYDATKDIAICSFDKQKVKGYKVVKRCKNYDKTIQGADCMSIGHAFGFELSPSVGAVRFTNFNNMDLVTSAPTNKGDSGGPVFNRKGECIGVQKAVTQSINGESAQGYAFATNIDAIEESLKKWNIDINN
ncbi:MAG: trypsin-like peptidase domain-containing protein [Christensenellales bacterium]